MAKRSGEIERDRRDYRAESGQWYCYCFMLSRARENKRSSEVNGQRYYLETTHSIVGQAKQEIEVRGVLLHLLVTN